MNKDSLNSVFIFALPIFIGGAMVNIFNIYIILLFLVLYLFSVSKIEVAISFAIILPPFWGSISQILGLPLPGALLSVLVAMILSLSYFFKLAKWDFWKIQKYIMPIVTICIVYYFLTKQTENSTTKIIGLLVTVSYTPFLIFLSRSTKVCMDRIAPIFLLYALLMLRVAYDFYGYESPHGLFDFTSFRLGGYANVREGLVHINYQNVGIAGVMSAAFWLSTRTKIHKLSDIVVLLSCFWIVLISGARQAIFGLILIIGIWMLFKSQKLNIKDVILFILFLLVALGFLVSLNIEFISNILADKNEIDRDYTYPFLIIMQTPWMGIGFGNYWDPIHQLYFAHNLFLEIICEMGLLGLFLLMLPVLRFIMSRDFCISQRFANGALSWLIYMPYLIRSLISDDLSRNIVVFIALFVFFMKRRYY